MIESIYETMQYIVRLSVLRRSVRLGASVIIFWKGEKFRFQVNIGALFFITLQQHITSFIIFHCILLTFYIIYLYEF